MATPTFLIIASVHTGTRLVRWYWDGDEFAPMSEEEALRRCAIMGRDIALASLQQARMTPGLAHMGFGIFAFEICQQGALRHVADERTMFGGMD